MNTKFQTNFTVYPVDANNMFPMIFGGVFFSQMDKAAATAVKRLLYESESCNASVTHKFEGTFHKPTYVGDLIFIDAEIIGLGKKSIVVTAKAYREREGERELVADAKFVFVSIRDGKDVSEKPDLLPYENHGLEF